MRSSICEGAVAMELHIECPICEQRFTIPEIPLGHPIDCPACKRKFDHTFDVELEPEEFGSQTKSDDESQTAYSNHLAVPEAVDSFPVARPVEKQSDYADTISAFHQLERKRRKRNRLLGTIFSSAILASIIGVMIGMLVKQIKKNGLFDGQTELAETELAESEFDKPASNDFGLSEHIAKNAIESNRLPSDEFLPADSKDLENDEPEPWVVPDTIPVQKFDYWNRDQVRDCWNSVHPHLVSLTVYDGFGSHEAVGTIIDSRGWILTSFNTLKGASKIEVRSSVGSVKQLVDADLLTDDVRGYVAVDAERDLAILSVNRRFVIAFSFLELARRNNVVEQQYLAQCSPPGEHDLFGLTETQIMTRGTSETFSKKSKLQIARRKIPGNELIWLTAKGSSKPLPAAVLPGTPLFNTQNQMTAINSFYLPDEKVGYFVPVDNVNSLIDESDGTVKPLSELGTGRLGNVVAVATTNPFHEKISQLNKFALACSEFNWIPSNREEYQDFQSFAEGYMEIERESRRLEGSTIPEELKIINLQHELESTLRDRFANLEFAEEKRLGEMNQQFARIEVQRFSKYVPFYGKVLEPEIGKQLVKVSLYRTDTEIKVPFPMTGPAPKQGSKKLFFVKTRSGRGSPLVDKVIPID